MLGAYTSVYDKDLIVLNRAFFFVSDFLRFLAVNRESFV